MVCKLYLNKVVFLKKLTTFARGMESSSLVGGEKNSLYVHRFR